MRRAMKRMFLSCLMLLFCQMIVAQQFVGTTPENRKVLIDECTGRNCQYCPQGHIVSNRLMDNNPGRVFAINIHSCGEYVSYFSPTTYPNLNTDKGDIIRMNFDGCMLPSAMVNRASEYAEMYDFWEGFTNEQLAQPAEVNIAGAVAIDASSRRADITVEMYYTANSNTTNNKLTVYMVQDSIWGSQYNGDTNPQQWVNGQYCHMHILRDIVTDVWGDNVSPTSQGSLVTKTYSYLIPNAIGDLNPVPVDLDNIFFIAFVSEDNATHHNVLNVCRLSDNGNDNHDCLAPSDVHGEYFYNEDDGTFGSVIQWYRPDGAEMPSYYVVYKGVNASQLDYYDEVSASNAHEYFYDNADAGVYYYKVTAFYEFDDGCSCESQGDTVVVDVNAETMVAENEVLIYPNPANDCLSIICDGIDSFEMVSSLGQKVKEAKTNEIVDVSDLRRGVYFVRIGGFTKRIVLE